MESMRNLKHLDQGVDLFSLTSIDNIIRHATKFEGNFKKITGIYFLFCVLPITNRLELIYVGQSINIAFRVGTHTQTKDFDFMYYIECPDNLLNKTERHYINVLHPRDNNDLGRR